MPQIPLVIVTYRDVFQWATKYKENSWSKYEERSAQVRLSPIDLKSLEVANGAEVKLSSCAGEVVVRAKLDPSCPQGFGYMPVSQYSNILTSYDPAKAKLPNFKRIEVLAEPVY
jgi:formylmethanofuran dehydrogenase subunit D